MEARKKRNIGQERESIHTKPSFFLGFIAFVIMLFLGLRHIGDADEYSQIFAGLCLLESLFAFVGLYITDILITEKVRPIPKKFKKFSGKTLFRALIILAIDSLIQFFTQRITMTISEPEIAMGIIFAGPCEELFFRGFLITMFVLISQDSKRYKIYKKFEISAIEFFGLVISAIFFAVLHTNFYGDTAVMLSLLIGGFVLGLWFLVWKDLTALMIAHILLNVITVGRDFYLVNLL